MTNWRGGTSYPRVTRTRQCPFTQSSSVTSSFHHDTVVDRAQLRALVASRKNRKLTAPVRQPSVRIELGNGREIAGSHELGRQDDTRLTDGEGEQHVKRIAEAWKEQERAFAA